MDNELLKKEQAAIRALRSFAPKNGEPYYLCYSGGKDSDVIRILAKLADVPHEIHHNVTSADSPITMRYIKTIPDVIYDRNYYDDGTPVTMWNLIPRMKFPPTRKARYCCQWLKEYGGERRVKVTGVRWDESPNRRKNQGLVTMLTKPKSVMKEAEAIGANPTSAKGGLILANDNDENRRLVEKCYRLSTTTVNPIVDWTDDDVWTFLRHYGCDANPEYQCGSRRVGCICCPLSGFRNMKEDARRYPEYRRMYVMTFEKMLNERAKAGNETAKWDTGEDVFRWWVGDDPSQITFDDYFSTEEVG